VTRPDALRQRVIDESRREREKVEMLLARWFRNTTSFTAHCREPPRRKCSCPKFPSPSYLPKITSLVECRRGPLYKSQRLADPLGGHFYAQFTENPVDRAFFYTLELSIHKGRLNETADGCSPGQSGRRGWPLHHFFCLSDISPVNTARGVSPSRYRAPLPRRRATSSGL
jgi:hypothetical protein